jgi:hypothetical protein
MLADPPALGELERGFQVASVHSMGLPSAIGISELLPHGD